MTLYESGEPPGPLPVLQPYRRIEAHMGSGSGLHIFAELDLGENGRSHARELFLRHRRPELYAEWVGRA